MPVAVENVRLKWNGLQPGHAAEFLQRGRRGQIFAQHGDDFFHALGGNALLPLAEQFLFARRDKEEFRRDLQRLGLIPDGLREREHGRVAQAREQLLLPAGQPRRRRDGGILRLSGDNFAHERMQRRGKIAQMPPQKFKRHLDGEKLVPLVGRPRGGQLLFAAPVKSGGQRREHGFRLVELTRPSPSRFRQTSTLPG